MHKQIASRLYKQLTLELSLPPQTILTHVIGGALIGNGIGCLLMGDGSHGRLVEWIVECNLSTEDILSKYNDEQKKALWEALQSKYGDKHN